MPQYRFPNLQLDSQGSGRQPTNQSFAMTSQLVPAPITQPVSQAGQQLRNQTVANTQQLSAVPIPPQTPAELQITVIDKVIQWNADPKGFEAHLKDMSLPRLELSCKLPPMPPIHLLYEWAS